MKKNRKKLKKLVFIGDDGDFRLEIVAKKEPGNRDLYYGEKASSHLAIMNGYVDFYNNYESRQAIKAGEVFVIRYNDAVGSELYGPHFVVAIVNSSELSPVVTVVPLKTYHPGKPLNPASDILIGPIPGREDDTFAVAVINQIKTIDKCRLFDYEVLNIIEKCEKGCTDYIFEPFQCQHKKKYRLKYSQIMAIREGLFHFLYNGFIEHKK